MTFNQGNTKASKLTGVEVMEIRQKRASGVYTLDRLAREYHVTSNTIRNIVNMVTWQNLPGVEPAHVMDEAAARSMRKLGELMGEQPSALGVEEETIAAMQRAVEAMPQPEFLKPNADIAAKMAAYGVRPPTPKELIEQLAAPAHSSRSSSEPSKPVIQAQSAVVDAAAKGGRDASAARCQTPECRYDAGHSGRCKSEQGFYLSAAPGGDDAAISVLDQITEESAK